MSYDPTPVNTRSGVQIEATVTDTRNMDLLKEILNILKILVAQQNEVHGLSMSEKDIEIRR